MKLQEPRQCDVDIQQGLLKNADGHYKKAFKDLTGLYADAAAFDTLLTTRRDDIAYEVTSYTPGTDTSDLILGVTRMEPGKVGTEFFMTRGHIHAIGNRPEIYYGQSGNGLMLLESPDGQVRICPIRAQSVCYVPPYWIHRSINVGHDNLVMMFAYPADSGQDYEIIAKSGGMKSRIVDNGSGGWREIGNPAWKPRSQDDIDKIISANDKGAEHG